jgi:hypothetical protein
VRGVAVALAWGERGVGAAVGGLLGAFFFNLPAVGFFYFSFFK